MLRRAFLGAISALPLGFLGWIKPVVAESKESREIVKVWIEQFNGPSYLDYGIDKELILNKYYCYLMIEDRKVFLKKDGTWRVNVYEHVRKGTVDQHGVLRYEDTGYFNTKQEIIDLLKRTGDYVIFTAVQNKTRVRNVT